MSNMADIPPVDVIVESDNDTINGCWWTINIFPCTIGSLVNLSICNIYYLLYVDWGALLS